MENISLSIHSLALWVVCCRGQSQRSENSGVELIHGGRDDNPERIRSLLSDHCQLRTRWDQTSTRQLQSLRLFHETRPSASLAMQHGPDRWGTCSRELTY